MTTASAGGAAVRRSSMLDVAVAAGVSPKTVSRVVNGEPHVSDRVRARVEAAIAELDFRPNAAARALASRRSSRVGMITLGGALFGPASILDGVEAAVRSAGYFLSVTRTSRNTLEELNDALDVLIAQGVDGVIISEPGIRDTEVARVGRAAPLLWFDSPGDNHAAEDIVVGADESGASRRATEYLLSLGHETVWHIGGPPGWSSSARRSGGWRAALEGAGAYVPPMVAGDWSARSGFEAGLALLEHGPLTAVFTANDEMAVGAIHAFESRGLRVPADVSVIGFDDDPVAAYLHAPLTTVRQPFDEMTRIGMEKLIQVMEGEVVEHAQTSVPATLIVRQSSGPAARSDSRWASR